MGLLSSLLGSAGVDVGGGGILGQLGNSLSQNSGALLGFASGGPEGMVQGRRSDMLAAAQRQEQEDKAHRIAAAMKVAPQYGIDPEIAKNDPEAAYKMIQFKMQKEQQDRAYSLQQQQFDFQKNGDPAAKWLRDLAQNDPTTFGNLMLQKSQPKGTDDQQELQTINRERAARGMQPMMMEELLANKRPQTNINNIPAQVERTEDIERAKANSKFLTDFAAQSGPIAKRSADLDFLGRVISKTNTGPGADTKAALDGIGQSLGLSSGQLKTQADAINAITNRIAPTLREAGSGSQSDAELAGFLKALPNLTASPQGNQLIQSTLQRAAKLDREKAKIANQYASNRLTATEARAKIADLEEQSIYASEEEKKIIENAMGFAPLSGRTETAKKGWKFLGFGD